MSKKMDKILAEISAGELIDKITILEIKKEKISNTEKLVEVNKELISLNETLKKSINDESKISIYKNNLKNVNLKLWDIEDGKRAAEKNNKFDEKFIELARSVYKFNDERAKIKLAINNALGSNIKEVKSYE
jgi:inner membrane protein involved in colicin E2 resistance